MDAPVAAVLQEHRGIFTLKLNKNKYKKAKRRGKGGHFGQGNGNRIFRLLTFFKPFQTVLFQKSRIFKETVKPALSGLAGSRRSR